MITFLFIMLMGIILWIYLLNIKIMKVKDINQKRECLGLAVSLTLLSILCIYAIGLNEDNNELLFHQQQIFNIILGLFHN